MKGLLAIAVLLGCSAQVVATTIDFNDVPEGDYRSGLDTEGYTFSGGNIGENVLGSDGMSYGCGQLASSGCAP